MLEIRFHGRGGQGAVTAALLLAEAAWNEGKWSQKIPVYTTDRRGAPVTAYLRLDNKPIRRTSFIYAPDYVVVIDERLLDAVNVTEGLKDDGTLIINNRLSPEKISLDHSISNLATVDATGISRELFGPRPLPITNTAMLGALSKVTELVKLDSINDAIKNSFKENIADLNTKAAKKGYEIVNQVRKNE
jgi:pyruvate ferredoxin oxidoreductase gamma subunit/2-oxoisovalerate ferredoxin oxidoreductase gamma subunit